MEEKLKTTLHCDDKEKLRRKLAQLQREYHRTVQRLKRAERSEAVREHVRNRITEQNLQSHNDPGVTSPTVGTGPNSISNKSSPSLILDTPTRISPGQGQTTGPVESDNLRRNPVVSFLIPSEAAFPLTPVAAPNSAEAPRPSSAHRLRSRRSRLRWQKRWSEGAEAGGSTDNSEEGLELSRRAEESGKEEAEKEKAVGVGNESEEFAACSEESPSLLLTHWSVAGHAGGSGAGVESTCTGGGPAGGTGTVSGGEEGVNTWERAFTDTVHSNTEQSTGVMIKQVNGETTTEIRGETNEGIPEKVDGELDREGQGGGLLSSCTLVDGLLFPAEYYVRTTRRMTSSHSQPNMQAVIRSQLNGGRQRRGRGRGGSRHTHANTRCQRGSQNDSCSPAASHTSRENTHSSGQCTSDGQSSCEIRSGQVSANVADGGASLPSAGPVRARRRRGRGKSQRYGLESPTGLAPASDPCLPAITVAPPCHTPPAVDRPEQALPPEDLAPAPAHPSPSPAHTPAAQSTSEVDRPGCGAAPDKVYPIFRMSTAGTGKPPPNESSWRALLLSASPSPATPLLPVAVPTLGQVLKGLAAFDFQQDFHLPDDQFASLKLHKLRQVVMASAAEPFASPSYITRSSIRLANARCAGPERATPLALPLSLTPTISASPTGRRSSTQDSSPAHHSEDKRTSLHSAEETLAGHSSEGPAERQPEERNASQTDKKGGNQDSINLESSLRCNGATLGPPIQRIWCSVMEEPSLSPEQRKDCPGESENSVDYSVPHHKKEDVAVNKTLLSSNCSPEETLSCPAAPPCDAMSPDKRLNVDSPSEHCGTKSPTDRSVGCPPGVSSQLLLSPTLPSPPCPRRSPCLLSSSPPLPSLGLTPHALTPGPPLTSSPHAPPLGSSNPAPSPPTLSPCPSVTPLPPSPPPAAASSSSQIPALSGPAASANQKAVPRTSVPGFQTPCRAASHSQTVSTPAHNITKEETAEDISEECPVKCAHTLKVPAGGCLVDACCVSGPSGGLCVAAAGKWAVCVWDQTSTSGWGLIHTWTFDEPVVSVFPVTDAPGMLCVTLGQLEIREVWLLSCSSFSQVLLCKGVVQAVVGVSKSRVVSSSHSAAVSTLQLFTVSGDSSAPTSRPLACPGVCVVALAAVDGLSDALLGSTESGLLFLWNLSTAQLLQRISLREGLTNTVCLRGYSSSGVLFVLLQHQLLSTLEEGETEDRKKGDTVFSTEEEQEQEKKKTALFSLAAVNPRTGKSVLATRLYQPEAWSGRLCDADVHGSSVVGLSQSGCVFVWEFGAKGGSKVAWAPESEGWQLARWGGRDTLLTGHHSGDLTLYRYAVN